MEPVAVWVRKGGEWALIHRCSACGTFHANRVAGDDNNLKLISLAVRPLSQPPFPLESLQTSMPGIPDDSVCTLEEPEDVRPCPQYGP